MAESKRRERARNREAPGALPAACLPASCLLPHSPQNRMLNVRLTPKPDADGENGGVAGVVLLTPAFFARFPNVRFFITGSGPTATARPRTST